MQDNRSTPAPARADDNPYAPPRAPVQDILPASGSGSGSSHSGQLAGCSTRLWAMLVDVAIGLICFYGIANMLSLNVGRNRDWVDTLLIAVLTLGQFLMLNGWFLVTGGQTIGKVIFKLRIVRPDGSPVSFVRLAGLRYGLPYVFVVIPFVGLLYALVDALFIFTTSRRCLHDKLADTIVVKA